MLYSFIHCKYLLSIYYVLSIVFRAQSTPALLELIFQWIYSLICLSNPTLPYKLLNSATELRSEPSFSPNHIKVQEGFCLT